MTDDQRRYISANSESLIGKVVEVAYQSIGAQGRLRHPAFVGIREDKLAVDCMLSQDVALERHWRGKEPLFNDR
jgi:ATP-dependent DNA ligase